MSAPERFERDMVQRALDHVEHVLAILDRQTRLIRQVVSLQEQYPAQALDAVLHNLDLARLRLTSAVDQLNLALTQRAPQA
jgi:hypothetical protein